MPANEDLFQQFQQKKKFSPEMEGMLPDGSEGLDALLNSFGNNIPPGLAAANGNKPVLNTKSPQGIGGLSKPILLNGLNHANVNNANHAPGANVTNPSQYLLQANARNQRAMGMSKSLSENPAVPAEARGMMLPGYANMLNANGAVNIEKQLFENSNGSRFGVQDMKKPPGLAGPFYGNENELDLSNNELLADINAFASAGSNMNGNHAMLDGLEAMRNNPLMQGKKGLKGNKKKKIEGKPRRPLSAYNLFFREERAKMIKETEMRKDEPDNKGNDSDAVGQKIGFENMAKIIGKRWRELPEDKASQFKKLAEKDMQRYKAEMETFLSNLEADKDGKKLKFYQHDPPQAMPINPTQMMNPSAIAGMQFLAGDENIFSESADNVSFDDSSEKQFFPKKKRKTMMGSEEDPKTDFNNNNNTVVDAGPVTKPKKGRAPKKNPLKTMKDPSELEDPEATPEIPKKKRGRKKKMKEEPPKKTTSSAPSDAASSGSPSPGLDVSDIYDAFATQPGNSLGDKTKVETGTAPPSLTNVDGKRKPDGLENWNNMLNLQQQQPPQPQHAVMMQLLKNAAAASGSDVSTMYGMLGLNNNNTNSLGGQTVNASQGDQNRADDKKGENQQEEQNMWHV